MSHALRLAGLAAIVLLLEIPVWMIAGLVAERRNRRDAAIAEVSAKWGNTQSLVGPALVLPYAHRSIETLANGVQVPRSEERFAIVLPDRLHARGTVDTEIRSRGIFSIPVYRLKMTLDGEFGRLRPADLGIDPTAVAWDRARLAIRISDVRAIQAETAVTWNGATTPFMPGVGGFLDMGTGIQAGVSADERTTAYTFSFPLALNGSVGVFMVPFARETSVELASNSPHPNFQGAWLPTARSVSSTGFTATWTIPSLGRSYPQAWTSVSNPRDAIDHSRFGVELIDPVDHYRMAERSVKYAALFSLLTFASVWLIEVLANVRVHPIPYLLLGAAMCVFYLLELSLSEHVGFGLAYARAAGIASGVAVLYGYLYVVLTNEDYALVIGAVGLFAAVAAVMLVTRRIDWYSASFATDRG
jgi:inner membrane protein